MKYYSMIREQEQKVKWINEPFLPSEIWISIFGRLLFHYSCSIFFLCSVCKTWNACIYASFRCIDHTTIADFAKQLIDSPPEMRDEIIDKWYVFLSKLPNLNQLIVDVDSYQLIDGITLKSEIKDLKACLFPNIEKNVTFGNVRQLWISGIDTSIRKMVTSLPRLIHLSLACCEIDDLTLRSLTNLKTLRLEGCANLSREVFHSNLKKLSSLFINCGNNGELIKSIGLLKNLKHLELDYCYEENDTQSYDEEIQFDIPHLEKLTKLKSLTIEDYRMTIDNSIFIKMTQLKFW
jgi:hypothetical protein